jgi:hypothetical protein
LGLGPHKSASISAFTDASADFFNTRWVDYSALLFRCDGNPVPLVGNSCIFVAAWDFITDTLNLLNNCSKFNVGAHRHGFSALASYFRWCNASGEILNILGLSA